jgi:uncharacterized protein
MSLKMSIIEKTTEFVKLTLAGAEGGHDWWHIYRVLENTRAIASKEKADLHICELGALLHDIADPKFHHGDEKKGSLMAREFLAMQSIPGHHITAVIEIIENISFSKEMEIKNSKSIELQVVQDADRLDAMGAIGIARAFNYGGFKNRTLYDPLIPPKKYSNSTEYRNSNSPTLNHFHEKLLLLKDLMNTQTGREMAEKRHEYMLGFLEQFHKEWSGTA